MTVGKARLLIFIVAYNAAKHIEKVLARIPKRELEKYEYEILIIDDQSQDDTFERALDYKKLHPTVRLTVLYNPENQGYGGNQKLGYHYAQLHNFEIVLLLHGDGQYAPEEFDRLVMPIAEGKADAVFGSRMMYKRDALRGKMPYYKFLGNILLTRVQNYILGTRFSEFHSGYRAYSVKSLAALPIERNSNDFHFDTQIIIQLIKAKFKILEVPIPTHYGDEVCYVNGFVYAYNIIKASIHSRIQRFGIYYKREYDFNQLESPYQLKAGYLSTHTLLIDLIKPGSKVLEIGLGLGLISEGLLKKRCNIIGMDRKPVPKGNYSKFVQSNWDDFSALPSASSFDVIILMDVLQMSDHPESILDNLRDYVQLSKPIIFLTVANVGFFITRFQLLLGGFNYGSRGILDFNHKRLFTKDSIINICKQSGMIVEKIYNIPAPFPEAFGLNPLTKILVKANRAMTYISSGLFSYEFLVQLKAKPMVKHFINYTHNSS